MTDRSNRGTALFNHIRALESLQEVKDEAASDFNARKAIAKEDGFDTNVLAAIMKRRKNGTGQTAAFDDILHEYELMIEQAERTNDALSGVTIRVVTNEPDPEPIGSEDE